MQRFSRMYFFCLDILWALVLIGLPLTTFPIFTRLTGAIVAPFSGAPVFGIIILWLLPAIIVKQRDFKFPIEAWPLFLFVIVTLISTSVAYFIEIPTFKNSTPLSQELRAVFTLVIGLGFYLVCAMWPGDPQKLRRTLQFIHIGGIVMLLWTFTQVIYILTNTENYPQWVLSVQNFLVIKPTYFFFRGSRTSGLAYEASWFAHQLVTLYIPLWLAATVERKSAFNFRVLRMKNFQGLTIENILLPIGLFEFLMSNPRISLVSLFLIFLLLFFIINLSLVRKITQWIMGRQISSHTTNTFSRLTISIVISIALTLVYLGFVLGAIYLLSHKDWRLALLFNNQFTWSEILKLLRLDESTIIIIAARLAFLERSVYWLTGWHVFNNYPWLGVGLGNAGFFFAQQVPSVGWSSYEIRDVLGVMTSVPNIKGFWVRLLAETGIIGFYIYSGWYYLMSKSAGLLRKSRNNINKIIATAGLFTLAAFISEGFSIDSFAMPYFWVAMGLVSSASRVYRREIQDKNSTATK